MVASSAHAFQCNPLEMVVCFARFCSLDTGSFCLFCRYFTYLSVNGDRMKFDLQQAAAEAR